MPETVHELIEQLDLQGQHPKTVRDRYLTPDMHVALVSHAAHALTGQGRRLAPMDPVALQRALVAGGLDIGLRLAERRGLTADTVRCALTALAAGRPDDAQALLEALVGGWEAPTPT